MEGELKTLTERVNVLLAIMEQHGHQLEYLQHLMNEMQSVLVLLVSAITAAKVKEG